MADQENVEDGFDEVSSLDERIHDGPAGLPTTSDGTVPAGLMLRMSRPDKSHEKRGIVFTVEDGEERTAVLFAA